MDTCDADSIKSNIISSTFVHFTDLLYPKILPLKV